MYMEKLPNGKVRYVLCYQDYYTGKWKRLTATYEKDTKNNRRMAENILRERLLKKEAENPTLNGPLTFGALCDKYNAYQKENVKLSTYTRNFHACQSLRRIIGDDVRVDRLTADYIKKKFNETGDDPGTLNERLTRLKAAINWAYKQGLINDKTFIDRVDRWKDIPHRAKIEDKFLNRSELRALVSNMDVPKWRDLTEFLALSGLRFGEAAALTAADVDLEERYIHVYKTLNSVNRIVTDPKTYTSGRDVYIQDELFPLLRMIVVRSGGSLLFPGTADGFVHYYAYNKYLKENSLLITGRELTTHALRHTHVSICAEYGLDLDAIARRMGHANSKVTKEIYFHVTEDLRAIENAAMNKVLMINY